MYSDLIKFYLGISFNTSGDAIHEIHTWSHYDLESRHDYIQWLFPLQEKSRFNIDAPILTQQDIDYFCIPNDKQNILCQNLINSFDLMLLFYGLKICLTEDLDIYIDKEYNFEERSKVWITPSNHNYMRLTRIIKSLTLLGQKKYASALYHALHNLYRYNFDKIPTITVVYWRMAL